MALAATSLACRVSREFAGKSREALSGNETLNDRRSMGSETLWTEISSLRGIDTESGRSLAVIFPLCILLATESKPLMPSSVKMAHSVQEWVRPHVNE